MAKTNNPIDFAATTATQFFINSPSHFAGPNNLDVNGGAAVGSFAGVATAPANSLIVSGNIGIGTSSTSAFGVLTLIASPTLNQSLLYSSGTSNFAATTTIGSINDLTGVGAVSGNTVTNAVGLNIEPNFSTNAGTITNACGLRISPGTASAGGAGASITNAYALYATTPAYTSGATNLYTAYFQGATGISTTNPLNLLDINGAAAIGTYAGVATAPTNGLIVSGLSAFGTSSANPAAQVTVAPNLVDSPTFYSGIEVAGTYTFNAVTPLNNQITGLRVSPSISSTAAAGTIASAYGMNVSATAAASGTGSLTGVYSCFTTTLLISFGTGAATSNVYGTFIQPTTITGTPTPTNNYGLYVTAGSGAINNYAAYFASSSVGVGLGIGTTAPKNTLDVAAGVAIGTYAGVNKAPTNGLIVSGQVAVGTSVPTPGAALTVGTNATNNTTQFQIDGTLRNTTNTPLYGFYNGTAFSSGGALTTNIYGNYSNHPLTLAASASVSNFYSQYYDADTASLGASATITNAYGLYALTPVVAKNNYCAYMQGTIYIPNGWTIGLPGGTSDICAAYVENGSYTPVLSGSTTAGTITYTTRTGFFTRIGKRFYLDVNLIYSAVGTAAGNIQVSLPLAARTVTNMQFNGPVAFSNVTIPTTAANLGGTNSTHPPAAVIASGGTVCTFFASVTAGAGASIAITPFTNPSSIQFSINYLVT